MCLWRSETFLTAFLVAVVVAGCNSNSGFNSAPASAPPAPSQAAATRPSVSAQNNAQLALPAPVNPPETQTTTTSIAVPGPQATAQLQTTAAPSFQLTTANLQGTWVQQNCFCYSGNACTNPNSRWRKIIAIFSGSNLQEEVTDYSDSACQNIVDSGYNVGTFALANAPATGPAANTALGPPGSVYLQMNITGTGQTLATLQPDVITFCGVTLTTAAPNQFYWDFSNLLENVCASVSSPALPACTVQQLVDLSYLMVKQP